MANSSPLHLTEIPTTPSSMPQTLSVQSQSQPQTTTLQAQAQINSLTSQAPSPSIQTSQSCLPANHQNISNLQQITTVSPQGILSPNISHRTQQASGSWAGNTGVTLPATLSPLQHSPGAFYGSYVQPSPTAVTGASPSPPAGSTQFSTMVATQAAYVYHSPGSNHAPVLLSNLASMSPAPTGQALRVGAVQQNQHSISRITGCETPPPTLLPAISSIHLSPASKKSQSTYPQLKPKWYADGATTTISPSFCSTL